MKLTPAQEKALAALTAEWRSAYDLRLSRGTLDALVRKKLADKKHSVGSWTFPRVGIEYRKRV